MRLSLALFASVLLLAPAAFGQAQAWDQEKVAAIAKELDTSVRAVYDQWRRIPEPLPGAGRRAYYQTLEELRTLRNTSRHLANRVSEGGGFDEALPVYRRLQLLRRNAAESARRVGDLSAPVVSEIEGARVQLDALQPYFEDAPAAE